MKFSQEKILKLDCYAELLLSQVRIEEIKKFKEIYSNIFRFFLIFQGCTFKIIRKEKLKPTFFLSDSYSRYSASNTGIAYSQLFSGKMMIRGCLP